MLINRCCYILISFLITFQLGCSNKINLENPNLEERKFAVTLIDSITHSSQLVSVQIFNVDNKHFGYVAGEKNTIEVYPISPKGMLEFLKQYQISDKFGGVRALTKIKNTDLLVLGNKADNALEVHKIKSDGRLEKINTIFDSDTTFIDEIVTIHQIAINDRTFIYAGGLDKGLSCYEITEDGKLYDIQSIKDNDSLFLHGIIGMSSLVIENNKFLVTGAFFDGGISCFQVMENGHLENVSNVKDDKTLFLNGTFPVNTVQLGFQNFLLVGHRHNLHYSTDYAEKHYHGDGINVFKINAQGKVKLHSQLKDNEQLLLKGSTRIEIIKFNEKEALVFIGTRDDKGIQICSLKENGVLNPIKKIDLGYSIYNGMTVEEIDNNWYLLTGAYDNNLIEIYAITLN